MDTRCSHYVVSINVQATGSAPCPSPYPLRFCTTIQYAEGLAPLWHNTELFLCVHERCKGLLVFRPYEAEDGLQRVLSGRAPGLC